MDDKPKTLTDYLAQIMLVQFAEPTSPAPWADRAEAWLAAQAEKPAHCFEWVLNHPRLALCVLFGACFGVPGVVALIGWLLA